MIRAITRNGILLGGIVACGLICVLARPFMISPTGAVGPTVLQSESWPSALVAVVLCLLLATAVAVIVGRLLNTVVALFVLGAGLFVLSFRLSSVLALVFGGGSLGLVTLETFLFAALVGAAATAVFFLCGPLPDIEPERGQGLREQTVGPSALVAAAAGLVVIPAVLVIAKSPVVGQTIGAVFVGSVAAGMIGRLMRPNAQPLLLFVSPILFGACGHLVAMTMTKGPLPEAYINGQMMALSYPMPIHYAAGSLMGVAIGLGQAKGFLHHEE